MITKTINLYKFEELTAEQQAKVIEKNRYINSDITCNLSSWSDCFIQDLEDKGFLNPDINYSLGGCQGDGASFTCSELDYNLLLKDYKGKHKSWMKEILEHFGEITIERINHNYYHELTCRTEFYDRLPCDYPHILDELGEIVKYIEDIRKKACLELESQLQAEIDYLESNECIAETLIANEYYFNGETLEIES